MASILRLNKYHFSKLILIFSTAFFTNLRAQSGSLDATFGNQGVVISSSGGARAVLSVKDNKIVTAGVNNGYAVLIRFNSDGSLDSSFGINGTTAEIDATRYGPFYSMAQMADGRLIAAGSGEEGNVLLIRYSADGKIDSAFMANTVAAQVDGNGNNILQTGFDFAIKEDGKITMELGSPGIGCVQFNSDGTLDTNFGGNNGYAIVKGYASDNYATTLCALPGGSVILAGFYKYVSHPEGGIVLVKFDNSGKPDSSFAVNGISEIVTNINPSCVKLNSVNKIIVGGYYFVTSNRIFGVAQFNANGMPDSAFGINGKIEAHVYPGSSADGINAMVIQPDDKIVVAGSGTLNGVIAFGLARFKVNGTLDQTFGSGGVVATQISKTDSRAYGVAIQADGRLVASGVAKDSLNSYHTTLARYNNAVTLATSALNLTVTRRQQSNLLQWQQAANTNTNYFIIQQSFNGLDFKEIGRVATSGDNNLQQSYSFTDAAQAQQTVYYRLQAVETNGQPVYSNIVLIGSLNGVNINVFPNPSKDLLYVNGLSTGEKTNLRLIDVNGKIVKAVTTKAGNYIFTVNDLPAGTYFLQVINGTKIKTSKLIKL